MKTLNNHLILYNADCPMCQLYTKAFVGAGLLEKNGRIAYQEYAGQACPNLDWQRAVNEIALVNQKTGEVSYGIKSLLKICGSAIPTLNPLFRFKPFVWLMSKIYAFISYNRRVIVPAPENSREFQYQPSFKKHYRIAYLVFSWLVTSLILSRYGTLMPSVLPVGAPGREFLICGGQIFFQGFILLVYKKEKVWDYLGNLMTISLGGALLLLPVLILKSWITLGQPALIVWFIAVVTLMFLEHIRRSKLLKLGYITSVTWILYRSLILTLIFLI